MSTTFNFPPGVGVDGSVTSVAILDPAGVATQVLDLTKNYEVEIKWSVQGPALGVTFGGNWSVQLYVESMGEGYEGDLGPAVAVPVSALADYAVHLPITAGANPLTPPPAGTRRIYKLVVLVSHELFGTTTMIAGFGEGPFFEIR